jgi:hypothetical protein
MTSYEPVDKDACRGIIVGCQYNDYRNKMDLTNVYSFAFHGHIYLYHRVGKADMEQT